MIDGRKIAKKIKHELKTVIEQEHLSPGLVVISVGHNDASEVYIRQKGKAARAIGIDFRRLQFEHIGTDELLNHIDKLNNDPLVHGILVQLPLPDGIDEERIMMSIAPEKDVDGFHPINYGRLLIGEGGEGGRVSGLAPCTPKGIMTMLDHEGVEMQGKEVVIVNHSNIVGKPLALMFLNRNATVTVCHVFTKDLGAHTRKADILVTGAGVPNLITSDMVKEGVVIVDVSMNRVDGSLCGDVAFDEVKEKSALITPVPGGVGPMTVAILMKNTVDAARSC